MAAVDGRALTDQQRRAIHTRDVSVALSAGAGCGKTFVLTERFLAELDPDLQSAGTASGDVGEGLGEGVAEDVGAGVTDGVAAGVTDGGRLPGLSQLVAITFTERAAREMRDRIRAACRQRAVDAPREHAHHWLDLIRELDSARISTIHSFCAALLRSQAVEAGLDPQFRVLEQAQADTLLYELIDDALRNRLAARDEAAIELVVDFGLESLRERIVRLLGRRAGIDWEWWREVTPDELVARWQTFADQVVVPGVLKGIARSPHARAVLRIARQHPPNHPAMQERCRVLLERLADLAGSADPAGDLATILENARVQGGGGKKAWPDEAIYEQFRRAAEGLREAIKAAGAHVRFDAAAARPAAEAGLRLLSIAEEIAASYDAEKQELATLDFDDLLIRAKRLLTAPEHRDVRRRLASQIRLLLVDEFQDTDPLQVELVEALCGEALTRGKLFFVGDYKQSIYRFRGADPHVFGRLRQATPPDGRLPLTLNFRSQPAILHFVNALFCDDLGPEYEPLAAHRRQVGPEPAVELLWVPDDQPEERSGQAQRLRRREADWIARRLRAVLDAGERIVGDGDVEGEGSGKSSTRGVRPGDVALLFRALSDVQHYEEALRRYGLDYYLVGGHAFYAQQEIYDVLNLLRSLASRCDEVSLAGVLRSPMFALEDETLFWLAQHPEGLSGGLFADEPPGQLSTAQRGRVDFARATLADLRAAKDRMPIAALVREALRRTGYDAVLLAEFLGQRKLANLHKLIDGARSFDRSGVFSLADFITQLSEFVARQPDEPLAATHPESTDVVRLMTIHQAKGLEFPVVVVPDVDRRMRGPSASVAFTPELGPMPKTPGPSGYDLYASVEREEEQAEIMRLLYVATTRAADYLILSSGVPKLGAARGPWMELIHRRLDPLTGQLRVALPTGYPEPKVRVTTAEPPLADKARAKAVRRSVSRMLDEAAQLAERGSGRVPLCLAPILPDSAARRQYSFSRLSGRLHPRPMAAAAASEEDSVEPAATSSRSLWLDPLGLGTLVHDVLAEIDLARPDEAALLVRRLAPRHLADVDEADPDGPDLDEPIEMVRRFVASPRAAEMAAAGQCYRELEFLLAWPPGTNEPEPRYLQGFIDCLYEDAAGRWVVLDYKTSQATASTVDAVAAEYEMQMLLYALAVERILGQTPADLVLCFLRPALEHHVVWDEKARARVVELVNQALAACVEQER